VVPAAIEISHLGGNPMALISRGMAAAGFVLTAFTVLQAAPASAKPARQVPLTPERMAQLQQVNSYVNSTVTEVSDMEQYGREDVWMLPTSGKGDCEDFALLKRKMLIERGWPASALAISVGATSRGEAHAVLTVATAHGEYVLDNLTSSILPPEQTGHVFHARQTGRGWVSSSGEQTSEPMADLPVASRSPVVARYASGRRRG
jgi:predicted transglutaminase-like cysteine proteinase